MKILIVDDCQYTLKAMAYAMKMTDYEITIATESQKALKLLKQQKFDVVISDFNMPKMNGIDLLKAVRGHSPEIKFILMTGYGSFKMAKEAVNYRAHALLEKPIDIHELIRNLEQIDQVQTV